jgi:aliphatic sulfonates family ABC transporter substrate-binding protein
MVITRTGRRLLGLVAAVGLASLLAACGSAAPTKSAEGGDDTELPTIRVAYAQGLQANFYYAMQHDLFTKHGVKVEGTKFDSGPALVSALASGSADVGYFGIPAMATANQKGAELQVFGIANNAGDMAGLYVNPDSGISSIEDLKGKTVATTQNTVAHIFLLTALEQAGMTPADVDIRFLEPSALVAGYTRGDIEAVFMFASIGAKLLSSGAEFVDGTSSSDLGVPDTGNFIASKTYIEDNTETLQAFLAAVDEATPIVNEDKDAYIQALDAGIGLAGDQAEIIYENQPSPCLTSDELLDPKSPVSLVKGGGFTDITQQLVDTMVELGILASAPDVSEFVTSAVVEGMAK